MKRWIVFLEIDDEYRSLLNSFFRVRTAIYYVRNRAELKLYIWDSKTKVRIRVEESH